ncbi:MAG: hypothetical protein ABIR47_14640 [Candidatus Kapaibacterium sp.]
MRTVEKKWRTNREKVEHARAFPGMLGSWSDAAGRTIREVVEIAGVPDLSAIIFEDDTFLMIAPARAPLPAELLIALAALRSRLETRYADAYARLDELSLSDRELTRMARMENILGAITGNIGAIPELYEAIPELLAALRDQGAP